MSSRKSWQEAICYRVNETKTCWFWTGNISRYGYGRIKIDGKQRLAHRFIYQKFIGKIKDGLVLDHICRNRSCVNPEHLRQVTKRDNSLVNSIGLGALNAKKTHCKYGHEFTKENIGVQKSGRYCKECNRRTSLYSYHNGRNK